MLVVIKVLVLSYETLVFNGGIIKSKEQFQNLVNGTDCRTFTHHHHPLYGYIKLTSFTVLNDTRLRQWKVVVISLLLWFTTSNSNL
jgi:hypothetical protein